MREVRTLVWCDNSQVHTEEGGNPRVEATQETVVSTAAGQPMVLDLCDSCYLLLSEMMDGWASMGSPANTHQHRQRKVAQPNTLPTTCPECGFVSASRQGLGHHIREKHGKGFKDYPDGIR